jgi:hypothetical protein
VDAERKRLIEQQMNNILDGIGRGVAGEGDSPDD